jgi:2',3'-cyclic-nucleotide 2'-phosphodiesterase (5'-nucleotidase family)
MKLFSLVFLLFLISASCGSKKISHYSAANAEVIDDNTPSGLDSLIAPYKTAMDSQMNEVIGKANFNLEKEAPESPLGNFAADVVYAAALEYASKTKEIGLNAMKRSICLLNFGGLRSTINKGDMTIGNVYEFMPFDNTLTLVKLSGNQMRELAIYIFEAQGQPISNAWFELSTNSQEMKIGGESYTFDEEVIVVTSDYLANGGDKMNFFKEPIRKWDSGILLRDVYINFIKSEKEIGEYPVENRINFVK